jgi:exosortase
VTVATVVRRDPAPAIFALAFAVIYGPLFPELARDWSRGGDFSHGFLVPVLALAMIHARRDRIRAAAVRPFLPGAILLAAAVGMYTLGVAASEFYLQRTSMVAFLGGWILLVWGPERARPLVFPVAFLLFMIPPPSLLWNSIAFPLQLLATRLSAGVLSWLGVEAARAGNVIVLRSCSLEVAQACSGLRSLVTLLALSAVLAEGTLVGGPVPRRALLRTVLFLSAVPVAVVVNALRVTGTAALASRYGPGVASGALHDAAGIVMFAVSMVLLWYTRRLLAWIESRGSSRPS